jgi:hypothetical protein
MRKVIVSNLVSLDGFFEGPNQGLDWHVVEAEFHAYATEMLRKCRHPGLRPSHLQADGGLLADRPG